MFYLVNLILPSTMLGILATASFLLPPDGSDRVNLGLTAFLAFSVLSLVVADVIPESTSTIPLLCMYQMPTKSGCLYRKNCTLYIV